MEDGTSVEFVEQLQKDLKELGEQYDGCDARIASGGGRMRVTMDRYEVGGSDSGGTWPDLVSVVLFS